MLRWQEGPPSTCPAARGDFARPESDQWVRERTVQVVPYPAKTGGYLCAKTLATYRAKFDTELCRREGISPNLYYTWSKEFLEAGKRRLMGDTKREASSSEVEDLRQENSDLKHTVADLTLRVRGLKKNISGLDGGRER